MTHPSEERELMPSCFYLGIFFSLQFYGVIFGIKCRGFFRNKCRTFSGIICHYWHQSVFADWRREKVLTNNSEISMTNNCETYIQSPTTSSEKINKAKLAYD